MIYLLKLLITVDLLKLMFSVVKWMMLVLELCHVYFILLAFLFVADANEIPHHTKFLLIASFLASYNIAKTDQKYFSEVYSYIQ